MIITFPDGSKREYENGVSALDIAASLSQELKKSVICCEIDGVRSDAFRPIEQDCSLRLLTFEDDRMAVKLLLSLPNRRPTTSGMVTARVLRILGAK